MNDAPRLARAFPDVQFTWHEGAPVSEIIWHDPKPDTDANIQAAIDAEPTDAQLDAAQDARPDPVIALAEAVEDLLAAVALLPAVGDPIQAKLDAVKLKNDYATLRAEALLL